MIARIGRRVCPNVDCAFLHNTNKIFQQKERKLNSIDAFFSIWENIMDYQRGFY
jgi:hypothetical protein